MEDKWISVKERLPEFEKLVLVFGKTIYLEKDEDGDEVPENTWIDVGHLTRTDKTKYGENCFFYVDGHEYENITHWQPLPKPPKE